MKKRMICFVLAMSLLLSLLPTWALATYARSVPEIWDGSVATAFAGGSGTGTDPYQISNGAELAYLAELVNTGKNTSGYYILTQDICLNDISNFHDWGSTPPKNEWIPIGSSESSNAFRGDFNGDGHVISGGYIVSENVDLIALFGYAENATISNLNITDSYFVGKEHVGGIIGQCGSSCELYNCYSNCYVQGSRYVGGIAGNGGSYRYCANEGTILGGQNVGGIAGDASELVAYCYNTGNISGKIFIGGVTGGTHYMMDCYNTGTITSDTEFVGGVTGTLSAMGDGHYLYRCYNIGTVACENVDGSFRPKIGAIIGEQGPFTAVNSVYFMDKMDKSNLNEGNWIFPDISDGLTDAEMRISDNFSGFDFTSVWYIEEGSGYPYPQLAFPDEARRYATLSVIDTTTNNPITDFTVNLDSSNGLAYVEVDGVHYIVGNGSAFDSNVAIEIHADGYDPFMCYSQDVKNSISLRYAPNNVLYLSPSGSDSSALDELKQAYILSHKQFYQNKYPTLIQNYGFKNALWQYDNGDSFYLATMGNWLGNVGSIATLSFGDIKIKVSYYEQFLIDLMSIMTQLETTDPLDMSNLEAASTVLSWVDTIEKINKDKAKMFETPEGIERWDEIWNNAQIAASSRGMSVKEALYEEAISRLSLPDGSGDGYLDQFIRQIQDGKVLETHPTLLEGIFKSASITETAISHITNTADTINAFRETTSAYVMVSTYASIHENLFAVLEEAASDLDSKYADGISAVTEKYTFDPENQEEFYRNYVEDLASHTGDFIYETFLQDKIQDISYNLIDTVINCPASTIKALTAAIQTGHFFGEGLTGLSGRTEQYTIIYYVAPLEAALEEIVREYGEKLVNNGTYEDAQRFEYAYRTLAATNQYLYKCYWAMGANETAFGVGDHHIGQMDDVMDYGASMQSLWKKTSCHGDTYIVDNKFKYTSIQCPVDVYVYDESNELVVSIVDEQIVKSDPAFTVLVSNGKKSLVYPDGHDYQIRIIARDSGTMNYLVSEIDGNHKRHIDSYNIPIVKNQEFIGEIPAEFNIEKTAYALKTGDEIVLNDYDSNDEKRALDAPTEIEWKGTSASWKAVDNAMKYSVGMYRNGEQVALIDTSDTSVDLQNHMKENGKYAFYVIALGDGKNYLSSRKSANSREIEVQTAEKSTDASVEKIQINGIPGVIDGTTISVVLPYGMTIPQDSSAISITTATGATYGNTLLTHDGGQTWTFTVTAEDGVTQKNYTVNVTIASSPETGYQTDLDKAKSAISQHDWTTKQSVANTEDEVMKWIQSQIEGMNLNDISYTISVTELVKAVSGTEVDIDGVNGKFTFEVVLSKGEGSTYVTDTVTESGVITASYFSGNYPSGNHSSGGGSSEHVYTVSVLSPSNGSVSASSRSAKSGATITVSVTPNEGYKLSALTVDNVDGDPIALTQIEDNKYIFTMPASRVTISASFAPIQEPVPSSLPFADISAEDWYADAIQFAYDNGLMTGTSETTFSPNETTTRGMVVTILYRLEGEPAAVASDFRDIPDGQYYADAVAWASANNIVAGYGDGTFGPNNEITREQMTAILYRYAQYKGYSVSTTESLNSYTDANHISDYAITAFRWICSRGIMAGTSATTLDPAESATRAQVAVILMRFCKEYNL